MPDSIRQPRALTFIAAGLILCFFIAALSESRIKSPMSDEPPHIASGLSYLATGVFRGNPQHPPLIKELSGLSLLAGGIRWPRNAETEAFLVGDRPPLVQPEWRIGSEIIAANGPDRVLLRARLPLILLACFLGAMLFVWGRQLLGGVAAAGAVLLFVADPTILAHSFAVTMDVGLAAFSILFLFALWHYLQSPGRKRLLLCGVALGALLAVKFSAVLLLPVSALLLVASLRWPSTAAAAATQDVAETAPPPLPKAARRVARNELCPCGSGRKYKACHGLPSAAALAAPVRPDLGERLVRLGGVWLAMCAVALVIVQALYFFPRDPLFYLHGLQKVNTDHVSDYLAYMAGEVRSHFPGYFAVAYLLKEPIATIILSGVGLVTLLRSRSIPALAKLFLLLPPAAIFTGTTLWADDLGIRYIIPALVFGHLLGGLGLATLLRMPAQWARWTAAALCLCVVAATCGIYPDHLSYFNETACLLDDPGRVGLDGGSKCGPAWLDDSNVDWQQGLKQLAGWLDRHAPGRTVRLASPFGFPAEVYGIRYEQADISELTGRPVPGLYAVSAHLVARVPAHPRASDWLRRTAPVAVVGHAFYIFDVPK